MIWKGEVLAMKRYIFLISISALLFCCTAWAEDPVQFIDPNLEIAVETALGVTDPTPSDMLSLYYFDAMSLGITDITGLEYATNLISLNLRYNQISDISLLSGLTNLTQLYLYDNQISDLSSVSGLTNLRYLEPGNNQISDISALSNLTNLTYLDLNYNQIIDVNALSGLTNLTRLYLSGNQITDISPLSGLTNLTNLDIGRNQIIDISDLSVLTGLEGLWLHENLITDISILAGFTNLTTLWLQQNPLNDNAYCTDLAAILANNPSLTTLEYTPNSSAPTGISASDGTYADKVSITWNQLCNGPNYSSFYQVYRSDSATGTKSAISSWQSTTSFDDTSSTAGVTYYYWVRAATNEYGEYATDYSVSDTGYVSGGQPQQQTCSITGKKWNDANGDGSSSGEQGLSGWTIFAEPLASANGQMDANEPNAITDPNGDYTISSLAPGTYRVHEVLQNDWSQTFPSQGFHEVNCTGNQTIANIDFGNKQTEPNQPIDWGNMPDITWSQPPIEIDPGIEPVPTFCGWAEPARSTEQSGQRRQWRMDADDFRCLGPLPVTRLRWWGSYKAWNNSEPPESQPVTWHIDFWANQIEGLGREELFPERIVWSLEIPAERVHFEPLGLSEFPQQISTMCFIYEVELEPQEWFHQAEFYSNMDTFWISITAIYPPDTEQVNMWGWSTRPLAWGNGAVMPAIMGEWPTYDERLFPGRIYPIENSLLCGQNRPYDLCFELLTEQPWVKWSQSFTGSGDWPQYESQLSIAFEPEGGELSPLREVVDDWVCEDGRPVNAMSWSGSYIGYVNRACTCEEILEPRRPDYFLLSIWTNMQDSDMGSAQHPGEKIWEYAAFDYDEVLVGYDRNPEGEFGEPVFRYSVRLPEDAWFRPELPESIYWFGVAAVFSGPVDEVPYQWGWTNHPHIFGSAALAMDSRSAAPLQWQECFDMSGEQVDMSFVFLTAP
jgi:hypothetical protein